MYRTKFLDIKRSLSYLFIICSLLFASSCADECEDVVCYNGGVCEDGKCACPSSYSGENCQDAVNASSTGNPCGEGVSFVKIELLDFPVGNSNGGNWDNSDCDGIEPDIYLIIMDNSGAVFQSEVINNCIANTPYEFNIGVPFCADDPYSTFVVRLFDQDNSGSCTSDQYMAGIQGKLYDNDRVLETPVLFSNPQSEIAVRFELKY